VATITVGPAAIDRAATFDAGNTLLDLANVATFSGIITTIAVYVNSQITTAKIGLFYFTAGSTYVCRSSVTTGVLTVGLNTLTGLSLAVLKGDVIGMYNATGKVDRADSGGSGAYVAGEYADAGDSASYGATARIIRLQGTGKQTQGFCLLGVGR
jgi:hypothetical protein